MHVCLIGKNHIDCNDPTCDFFLHGQQLLYDNVVVVHNAIYANERKFIPKLMIYKNDVAMGVYVRACNPILFRCFLKVCCR